MTFCGLHDNKFSLFFFGSDLRVTRADGNIMVLLLYSSSRQWQPHDGPGMSMPLLGNISLSYQYDVLSF
jgi:hypothetical protein